MVFSSVPFMYYFLPVVLIIYFLSPGFLKNTVLLMSSLFFYGWGEPHSLLLIIVSIAIAYVSGILIDYYRGRGITKLFLAISVCSNLGALLYFKYADFFIKNFNAVTGMSIPLLKVALPIGISFYTFQILSYTVDVYRGQAKLQKNPLKLATYVTMFPQLIAGPIVRYTTVEEQLENRDYSFSKAALGIRRFVTGLGKKVLIANNLAELCADFEAAGEKSVLFYWMFAVATALQIYFDFSGYSDMAIGLGKILGFDFLENFNYPFIASSVTDFWRRWHMSLGTWFRDYVYIPLGGNRVPFARWIFNTFVVWFLTGFWHGAEWNFILWGLYFAVLLVAEKMLLGRLLDKSKLISIIYMILVIPFSFILFNSVNLGDIAVNVKGMWGLLDIPFISGEFLYYLRSYGVLLAAALIGATPLPCRIYNKAAETINGRKLVNVLEPLLLAAVLMVSTAYLVDGSFNPFLYFRF